MAKKSKVYLKGIQNQGNYSNNFIDIKTSWKALAKIDYSFYVEYVHKNIYKAARHTDLICENLQKVEAGKIKRLMVFMPPRHSKSMTITETFPSWFIGRQPNRRVIIINYSEFLAAKFGRANKNTINEYGPDIFNIELNQDNSAATNWGINGYRGGLIAAGIGGGITGEGADLLIVDDPYKNRKQADSPTYRDFVWSEWQNTLLTRLQAGGAVIIVMTRWHEDDLAGRILSDPQLNKDWTVLSLPAEAEENDPLGRTPGDPLWPEIGFDRDWLQEIKKTTKAVYFSALYQQHPAPAEGQIFLRKHLHNYYKQAPSNFDLIAISLDAAFKDQDTNDRVAFGVWGKKGADKYLLDHVKSNMDFMTTVHTFRALTAKWPQARAKLVEDKANGPAIISVLRREIPGIIPINPGSDSKVARATAASLDFDSDNVFLPDPKNAPWVNDYIEELAAFPNAAHDDDVDQTSQFINWVDQRYNFTGTAKKPAGF